MTPTPPHPIAMPLDATAIAALLPHRHPFLLIDRVVAIDPGRSLRAIKNVTVNEPFFTGHFPGHPVMPGVLIIESMAQASGVLTQLSEAEPGNRGRIFYLVRVDKARFTRIVVPGDQLVLEVEQVRMLRRMGLYRGRALVDGVEVASAELLCAEQKR